MNSIRPAKVAIYYSSFTLRHLLGLSKRSATSFAQDRVKSWRVSKKTLRSNQRILSRWLSDRSMIKLMRPRSLPRNPKSLTAGFSTADLFQGKRVLAKARHPSPRLRLSLIRHRPWQRSQQASIRPFVKAFAHAKRLRNRLASARGECLAMRSSSDVMTNRYRPGRAAECRVLQSEEPLSPGLCLRSSIRSGSCSGTVSSALLSIKSLAVVQGTKYPLSTLRGEEGSLAITGGRTTYP